MPHPYTAEARVKRYLAGKGERLAELLDRNRDGIADADSVQTILADTIERVDNLIDAELGTVYSVPFGAVTPTAPATATTYGQVADLSDVGVRWLLWSYVDPKCSEAVDAKTEFDTLLEQYRIREKAIPGAALLDAGTRRRSVAYESGGVEFAGSTTNGDPTLPYTSSSVDQTRGVT